MRAHQGLEYLSMIPHPQMQKLVCYDEILETRLLID